MGHLGECYCVLFGESDQTVADFYKSYLWIIIKNLTDTDFFPLSRKVEAIESVQ